VWACRLQRQLAAERAEVWTLKNVPEAGSTVRLNMSQSNWEEIKPTETATSPHSPQWQAFPARFI